MMMKKNASKHKRWVGIALWECVLATVAVGVPCYSFSQEVTVSQIVVRDDQSRPVKSEIFMLPQKAKEELLPLGETDSQGIMKTAFKCPLGAKVQARPYSKSFTYSRKAYCKGELELRVDPIRVAKALQANLKKAAEVGDFATAILISNELSNVEIPIGHWVSGAEAENLAVLYAEKEFDVPNGALFDKNQGKTVMSAELVLKIKDYQKENGLEVNGQLDYKTVSARAGKSSSEIRYFPYWHDLKSIQ